MTTSNAAASRILHRRRERRAIPPFGDGNHPNRVSNLLDSVLAPCRFAPFPHSGLIKQEPYYLNADEVNLEIAPRFQFELANVDELVCRLNAQKEDFKLSLSARSRHHKRYEILNEWDISSVPTNAWSPDPNVLRPVQSHRDISFILAMRVTADRPELRESGLEPGKVLCRKEFNVKESVVSANFPFGWGEFGEGTEYPGEMLWAVKWMVDEGDDDPYLRPVDEVLMVWGNSKAEAPLLKMAGMPGARNLAWRMLTAEIVTEIWWEVLQKIAAPPPDNDESTLAGQIFSQLSQQSGRSYEEILDLSKDEEGRFELRKLISSIVKVVD